MTCFPSLLPSTDLATDKLQAVDDMIPALAETIVCGGYSPFFTVIVPTYTHNNQ